MATYAPTTTTQRRAGTTTATRAGAMLIALTGLIHVVAAPDQFSENTYVGVLFLLAAAGSALVAGWLWVRDDARAWALGALVAVCCLAGYIWSRTAGLPGLEVEAWDALGIASVVVEAGFLACALRRVRR